MQLGSFAVHETERIARGPLLIVCAALALILRWPAYGLPWDRDASVYAVIGRFQGLPYRHFYDHKQPLIYPVYGLIDAVGLSPRLVSALVSFLAAWLVFVLTRRAWAAVLVVIVGASRFVHGFDLNTEHLVLLVSTGAVVLAVLQPRRVVLVGVLCGVAILTKAVAVLVVPAALLALGWRAWPRFVAAVAAPLVLVALSYLVAGAFGDLWHWNWTYNREYASVVDLGDRITRLNDQWPSLLLIAAAAVGAVVARRERLTLVLSVWLAGAVLGALAGGYAYAHYFVPVIAQRTYGDNAALWEQIEPVGKLIHDRARPGDTLYVAESEAGFYQRARVTPASPLLYDSILALEPSRAPELCASPPRFLVLPHGVLPSYAHCLTGYAPLPGVPAPIQVLVR
jgi:hypothetical protein